MEGKDVHKKSPQGLDSFYNYTKAIYNIQCDPSQNRFMNSCKISSSILSEMSRSVENNLQTLILESFLSNSEVPENQINIENPSDNSAFEKKRSTHTNIDTFKRKPESHDMLLHFLRITKLEAKFDALKSYVTCEISILANK